MSDCEELTEKEKYAQELVAYVLGERPDCPKEPKPQEAKNARLDRSL